MIPPEYKPILATVAIFILLLISFAVLDLAGQVYPIFGTRKWGTFAEWALAIATPATIVASYMSWVRDRADRLSERNQQRRDNRDKETRRSERQLAGVRLESGQGVGGPIIKLVNESKHTIELIYDEVAMAPDQPTFIRPLESIILDASLDPSTLRLTAFRRVYKVTESGVKEVNDKSS